MVVVSESDRPRKRADVLAFEVNGDDGGGFRERPPSKASRRARFRGEW
jgi:hypothetical protein